MLKPVSVDQFPDSGTIIVVGENGAGKSQLLVQLAKKYVKQNVPVVAISNTPYDRFVGVKGIKRISSADGRALPAKLLKEAIAQFDNLGSSLNAIGATLSYCGYDPSLFVRISQGRMIRYMNKNLARLNELDIVGARQIVDLYFSSIRKPPPHLDEKEIEILPYLMSRVRFGDALLSGRFDFRQSALGLSMDRDLANLIRYEKLLKKVHAIGSINLSLLKRRKGINILQASSGELSLISTYAFLAATLPKAAVILIDEPENSLHPKWQKEYVEKLLGIVSLRSQHVVISTHSPIIVLGAQASDSDVSVYRIREAELRPLDLKDRSESVEEMLWEAFSTITPKNHFVSEQIADELDALSANRKTYDEYSKLIEELKLSSFSEKQKAFLDATLVLAADIENRRLTESDND